MTAVAMETLVTLEDIRAAAAVLKGVAVRTPLLQAEALSELLGASIYVKPEVLQRGGEIGRAHV